MRMNHRVLASLFLLASLAAAGFAEPPSSAFLYQGHLIWSGTTPDDIAFDFQFTVFNAPTSGSVVGSTITLPDIVLDQGLFNVELDFGNDLFIHQALWLEVRVRLGSSTGSYTVLSPRQALRLFALNGKQAPLKAPLTGTVTVPTGSMEVTGVGTFFTSELAVGDSILIHDEIHTVAQIDSDTRLFLVMPHGAGALSEQAFIDGTLFRVRAGDYADKLVVDREGVKVGEQATPISRIEHGTIGDCSTGKLATSGTVTYAVPFIKSPRVFLTTERTGTSCFTATLIDSSATAFSWSSWGNAALYTNQQGCRCIHWMAIGI